MSEILEKVKHVFDIEIKELKHVKSALDDQIAAVVQAVIGCSGKVVVCGMGKPGHIAGKISATMSSLGIHSCVLHPAEAMHGDLGMLSEKDIIIFISNSGETSEICNILPNIKLIGIPIAAITSNKNSTLARFADLLVCRPEIEEACTLHLAPTSSTTAALVLGDAITVVASEMRRFETKSFALYHPAGALGRKLTTRVEDIMHKGEHAPIVGTHTKMQDAIVEMCRTGLGAVVIADGEGRMQGLITDGDL